MSREIATTGQRSRRMGRIIAVLVLILSICATALTRQWVMTSRSNSGGRFASEAASGSEGSSFSAMPSYATALLLGGLRGPLVMILWTTSETQKQEHDLQDFDTKVEWIRLLQPEFDTVHLFQIWNKAYNISVMMADQESKYRSILDAVDYGQKVDRERPDDINIISALAQIYGDKLGTSQEHPYYRHQMRKESQTRYRVSFPKVREHEFRAAAETLHWNETDAPVISNEKTQRDSVLLERWFVDALKPIFTGDDISYDVETRRTMQRNDPGWRALRMEPILDVDGNILPDLLAPRFARPSDWPADKLWYDGSQLEFLKQYEPFPYGVSTLALAYNAYQRSQLLQKDWNEKHIQNGEIVVDSRPPINQKLWARDEWERGRRAELRMWGSNPPMNLDPDELELPSATVGLDRPVIDPLERQLALYSYNLAHRLFIDSRAGYERHIRAYPYNAQTYFVHIDDTKVGEHMMLADYDYLKASMSTGAERAHLIDNAIREYTIAGQRAAVTGLKFYFEESLLAHILPIRSGNDRYTRANVELLNPDRWVNLFIQAQQAEIEAASDESHVYHPARDAYGDDRKTYVNYVNRADARVHMLQDIRSASSTNPTTQR